MKRQHKVLLSWLLTLAALAFAARTLSGQIANADWSAATISPGWLAVAFTLNMAYVALYAWLWIGLADAGGLHMPPANAYGFYFAALAYKYVPGRVAGFGYRVWSYTNHGGWTILQVGRVLYGESVLAVVSGVLVALTLAPVANWHVVAREPAWILLVAAALLGLWALPWVLSIRAHAQSPLRRRVADFVGAAMHPLLLVRYATAWFLLGAALLATLIAVGAAASWHLWLVAVWAYAVAGLAGILFLFAPAGIGVRDGVLAIVLATVLPPEMAAIAAIIARCMSLASEMLWALIGRALLHAHPMESRA
jgi:hypothetical protein